MKIEIEKIKTTLLENEIDPTKVEEIIAQLEEQLKEEIVVDVEEESSTNEDLTDNSEDLPKIKYETVIILNDKEGYLRDKEIAGWVVKQEENADAGLILSKLKDAAKDQNESAKKRKNIITSLVDLFDGLKPKWTKSKNIKILTKDLTRVIISDGRF